MKEIANKSIMQSETPPIGEPMEIYIYHSRKICKACADDIKAQIVRDKIIGTVPIIFYGGPADKPLHCDNEAACLKPFISEVSENYGTKIGKFLENPLTKQGLAWTREFIEDAPDYCPTRDLYESFYKSELGPIRRRFDFRIINNETIEVSVKALTREEAGEELEQMDYKDIEAVYTTKVLASEYYIEDA